MFSKWLAGGLLALAVSGVSSAALAQDAQPQHVRVPRRIQRFDANHDGRLQANEVPPRLREWFVACDTNRDNVVTIGEVRAYNRAHPRHHHHRANV